MVAITTGTPSVAKAGDTIHLTAQTDDAGVPALEYHWDFGDGTSATGPKASHAYTRAAEFTVRL